MAPIALAACGPSLGNPKLDVSIASCDAPQYAQLPAPAFPDDVDAGDLDGRLAAWGVKNKRRAEARAACEKRVREHYAQGGL